MGALHPAIAPDSNRSRKRSIQESFRLEDSLVRDNCTPYLISQSFCHKFLLSPILCLFIIFTVFFFFCFFILEKDTARLRARKRPPAALKRENWCPLRKRAEERANRKNQRAKILSRERRVSELLHPDHVIHEISYGVRNILPRARTFIYASLFIILDTERSLPVSFHILSKQNDALASYLPGRLYYRCGKATMA